jgi:hypothetical protein
MVDSPAMTDTPRLSLAALDPRIKQAESALRSETADGQLMVRREEGAALDHCHRLLGLIRVVLVEKASMLPNRGWCVVVAALHAKMLSTLRAAHTVAAAGHAREVQILVRSGLEALIIASFIAKEDSARRARRWAQFADVEKARFLKKKPDRALSDPKDRAARRRLYARARRAKRHFPRTFWASGLGRNNVRDLAGDVGLLWHYDMLYWWGSQGTHSTAIGLEEYLGVGVDGSPRFKLGLSTTGLRIDLIVCSELLIRGLMLMNDVCKLGVEGLLPELVAAHETLETPNPGESVRSPKPI